MVKRYKNNEIEDPYACVRRSIPRPGKVIKSEKDYSRKNSKRIIEHEIEEFEEDISPNVEINI